MTLRWLASAMLLLAANCRTNRPVPPQPTARNATAPMPGPSASGRDAPPSYADAGPAILTAKRFLTPSCVEREDGHPWCWGWSSNDRPDRATEAAPPHIEAVLEGTSQLGGGALFAYLLRSDGSVWTWGVARQTELHGTKVFKDAHIPERFSDVDNVAEITQGDVPCVLFRHGGVSCWAEHYTSGHDEGVTTGYYRTKPVAVRGVRGAKHLFSGSRHVCAILADDTVSCWGYNEDEIQRGKQIVASAIAGTVGAVEVAVCDGGIKPTGCARLQDGAVRCWGSNQDGLLGDESPDHDDARPVPGLARIRKIACRDMAIAIDDDGKGWAWGFPRLYPKAVKPEPLRNLPAIRDVSLGFQVFTIPLCVIREDGGVECWSTKDKRAYGAGALPDITTEPVFLGVTPGHKAVK